MVRQKKQLILDGYHSESNRRTVKTGVYSIIHESKPNIYYVGSASIKSPDKIITKGFYLRWRLHLYNLKLGIHHSKRLQRVCSKYGTEGLRFSIIELIDNLPETLIRETFWISKLEAYTEGYNGRPDSLSSIGCKHLTSKGKRVTQYSRNGKFIRSYKSARRASIVTKVSYKKISLCCKGNVPSAGGFVWRFFKDEYDTHRISNVDASTKKVTSYTGRNKVVNSYNSITEASKDTGITLSNISMCCSGKRKFAGGLRWEYT